jgi:Cu-Zn family superoxide dismutase
MRNLIIVATVLVFCGCARDEQATSTTSTPPLPPMDQDMPQDAPDAASTVSVTLEPTQGNATTGMLSLAPFAGGVSVTGSISGLQPNSEHGFHVHENGDCSAPDATSAGEHFSPLDHPHGAPGKDSHVGDLGNVTADANGVAKVDVQVPQAALEGATPGNIRGRAIIVHARRDDLSTQPSGDSGNRLACGVIPG